MLAPLELPPFSIDLAGPSALPRGAGPFAVSPFAPSPPSPRRPSRHAIADAYLVARRRHASTRRAEPVAPHHICDRECAPVGPEGRCIMVRLFNGGMVRP